MKYLLTFGILFLSSFLFSQRYVLSDYQSSPASAVITGSVSSSDLTFTAGNPQATVGDQMCARERGPGKRIVGYGALFSGGGNEYFFNFQIFGNGDTAPYDDQLDIGECFTLEIYNTVLDMRIPVLLADEGAVNADIICDPPLSSSLSNSESTQGTNLEISLNGKGRQMGDTTIFAEFSDQTGGSLPNWTFGNSVGLLLPVTYTSISLTNNDCRQVSFDWTTSSEINNEGFYVERKVEGQREWESLDFVKGHGTTYEEIDYRFVDSEITEEKSLKVVYYRLKQVDFDGRIEYSDTKSVRLNCGNSTYINVFPNPASDYVKVEINHEGLDDDDVILEIYSMSGELISRKNQKLTNKEITEIQTGDFAPGIYTIQAFTNNLMISHTRFTKN